MKTKKSIICRIISGIKNTIKRLLKWGISIFLTIFENISEHKIRYLILISLLIFSCTPLVILLFNNRNEQFFHVDNIYENSILIQQNVYIKGITIGNISIMISSITLVIAAIWAVFQYDKNIKARQQSKGSMICFRFSDKIVKKLSIICSVLEKQKIIKEEVLTINPADIHDFDLGEFSEINDNCEEILMKYKKLLESKKIEKDYYEACQKVYSDDDFTKRPQSLELMIVSTLNELEAICMDISSSMAGSQFIYPSLHQIFLGSIHILYLHICNTNKSNVMIDKCYTNIIYVYNEWTEIRNKDCNKRQKVIDNIEKINKNGNKKLDKIKNKMNKEIDAVNSKINKKIKKAKKTKIKRV